MIADFRTDAVPLDEPDEDETFTTPDDQDDGNNEEAADES